jgi:hypothetical protein
MGPIKFGLDKTPDRALGASAAVTSEDVDDSFPAMRTSSGEGRALPGRGTV